MLVWRDVNIRRSDQFNHLLRTHESVAENHTRFYAQPFGQALQRLPVSVAFPPQYMRVRDAGNHVKHVAVALENLWQRFYDVLYSFVRREQSKRQQNLFSLRPEPVFVKTWVGERQIGDAMWNQVDLLGRNLKHFLQDRRGLLAHDDQAVRKRRNLRHHPALVGIWLTQDCVQGRSERHPQSSQKFQNMPAGEATKDSIFVLQANQIDVAEVQEVRGLPVGSQIIFRQLESHSRGIRITLFGVVDRKGQQLCRAIFCVYCVAQIRRERRNPASPRKIIPHDRDSIGKCRVRRKRFRRYGSIFQHERLDFDQRFSFRGRYYFRQRHSISFESTAYGRITPQPPKKCSLLAGVERRTLSAESERSPACRRDAGRFTRAIPRSARTY